MSRRHYKVSGGGVLPAGYAECEWIESTGTQYIDTGVKGNILTGLEFTFAKTADISSYDAYIGGKLDDFTFARYSRLGVYLRIHTKEISTKYDQITDFSTLSIKNGIATYHSKTYSYNYDVIQSASDNIHLCNVSNLSRPSKIKIKKLLMYGVQDTIERDTIPALRLSDNKPGLYDLCGSICPLTGTPFYINAGTGEFLYKLKS